MQLCTTVLAVFIHSIFNSSSKFRMLSFYAHARFRFRFCLLFNRFTTREVELEDALGGQQGLGFTHMYTRMARVTDPTQVSPVPL